MKFEDVKKRAAAEWKALQTDKRPRILLGMATCGRAAGGDGILEAVNRELAHHNIEATVTQVGCIGLCYAEPLLDIIKPGQPRICYGSVTAKLVPQIIEDYLVKGNPRADLALGTIGEGTIEGIPKLFDLPILKSQVRVILRNCGYIDPEKINDYVANDGYNGLVKAFELGPEKVIEEIKKAGLKGRGGAGFSTGQKWDFCRKAPGTEKYIICNADEGDPGAFMNRSLLEGDPHSVLEGMVIGAYAIGAKHGYIYCRAEYPLAIERLNIALNQMREYGILGKNILGSGFDLELEVKEGAGAFVCGEETALMESIEGKRGMPRPRPPYPAVAGLWGKPTNINNVETWANAAVIMQRGADWYTGIGNPTNHGTKTFSLVGKIQRTGLIEVPLGMPLRQIIYEIGGGMLNGKHYKAVQTGGPSGGCLPTSLLDSPVDYESLVKAGSMMGSGGMVVTDEDTCMVDFNRFFLTFTQSESCGKCVSCRVGTHQMLMILERITKGEGTPVDIERLEQLCETVRSTALCGLGQTAPNPVLSTLKYFRDEYEAHIHEKRCPAKVCTSLINYYIKPEKCEGCMICLHNCLVGAISGGKRMVHVINQEKCSKCGVCFNVCPKKFDAVVKVSGEKIQVPTEPIPVFSSKNKEG